MVLESLFVLCVALPTNYTNYIKIDTAEMYTIITSEQELKDIKNTLCNIKLLDHCHSEWMCPPVYESLLPIKKPKVQYFIANTQTGTMAYMVKR